MDILVLLRLVVLGSFKNILVILIRLMDLVRLPIGPARFLRLGRLCRHLLVEQNIRILLVVKFHQLLVLVLLEQLLVDARGAEVEIYRRRMGVVSKWVVVQLKNLTLILLCRFVLLVGPENLRWHLLGR